jgi:ubiquinone biosynthesis protein COQ4
MTETISHPGAGAGGSFAQPRRNWGAALKALRRLMTNKEDTGQVFEIMRALNGDSTARNFDRLLKTPGGGRLAYEHVELEPLLMDDAWLDSFAEGSVGAAYRTFVRSERLSAEGLADISRQGQTRIAIEHPYAWFGRRIRDTHDIWHILTGYHRDGLGEACLVAFSYAQTGGVGWGLIALGALLRTRGQGGGLARKAIWQGYQRGRRASWLPGEDYVALMSEPLEAARRRFGLTPATAYDAVPAALRNPAGAGS